ncbi:MAG: hypothetical protein AAFX94_00235 [Myxococcota bacterium]
MFSTTRTAVIAACLLFPGSASAQYKNQTLGFDAGIWIPDQPPVTDDQGNLLSPDQRPLRFNQGLRIGGEANFKMNSDRWWMTLRVSMGMLFFDVGDFLGSLEQQFDAQASATVGEIPIFALEGQMGLRYYFFTDRIRPYAQVAISYTRLLTFAELANDTCSDPVFCSSQPSNKAAFLPTSNIGAIHLQPGLEYVFKRDVAIHFYLDVQRWIRFSAADNWAPVFGAGVTFFQ